jgi:hypothetical protein
MEIFVSMGTRLWPPNEMTSPQTDAAKVNTTVT